MATDTNINITSASLRGSPSDRIIKPRPRKDSLQSISGSDSHPGRIVKPRARKSPGSGAKRSEPAKRKFICSFSHYGCDVALSSKNEWKRHVSIQHLQLGFYRCDVGSCNPDLSPNVPGHKRVYNDFNRKDLFTQHHRRMHKPDSGPGSGTYAPNNESSKDWRAFEDSLEEVRARCWKERRKAPHRSTCGFCGRTFEGEGSWNERMEHVGGHFSRDIVEAKEEREDEDLTNWAVKEAIIKDGGNGRHVLIDQPAAVSERPYISRDRDISMTDAPTVQSVAQSSPDGMHANHMDNQSMNRRYTDDRSPSFHHPPKDVNMTESFHELRRMSGTFSPPTTNGTTRPPSTPTMYSGPSNPPLPSPGQMIAPAPSPGPANALYLPPSHSPRATAPLPTPPERRGYNLAPPPLQPSSRAGVPPPPPPPPQQQPPPKAVENGSGDRLEDLINQLIKPKPPKTQRRLTWKCDCNLEMSVDVDEADAQAIETLQDISIICSKTSNAYLKVAKSGSYHVVKCNELEEYIQRHSKQPVEKSGG